MALGTAQAGGATTVPAPPVRRRLPGWAKGILWAVGVIAILSTASYLTGVNTLTSTNTAQTALRLALPILLAALGGLWAERAGVVNIGLEGMMILGTWGAAWGAYHGGPWLGLVAAMVGGALGGLLHAVATVTFNVNHIVSGVAINLLGLGVAKYLSTLIFQPLSGNPRQSPTVPTFDTYSATFLSDWLSDLEKQQRVGISDAAGLVNGLVTGVSPLTIIAILLVPVSYLVLWRTRFGLRLRSCGENPVAAESLGVNVYAYRYTGVLLSGALAGLGGAALVLLQGGGGYLENQTNGRGYIGLAAMIFGNWRPGGLLGGAALFGYSDGLQLAGGGKAVLALLYGAVLLLGVIVVVQLFRRKWLGAVLGAVAAGILYWIYWANDSLPGDLIPYTPHVVTLIVLAVASQRLRMPKADGARYRRGEGD
ncbi:simple sugar transport system permease protein [Amycolatopsis bartoniae]|uniref:ABC transporter permease n=1 Tax=Amycolatopsis bartoniae TaxID=941986 RepID=A0A8H9J763_9PSEU|nr:ABC transporter permease [Amycolatopsis bartoniae]MBB2937443.1 simple sugar transport system permease protein [Amycolatopsis bartoniae]TVT00071.1 ABC transporter permease [Amycolatopsis bartoniae]GHF86799.1 ABC transporter permease [Amycolatopsis bartoniae]